MKEINKKDI